ncbi:MAG: NADH-ubiquinone oxidoreductase-like protein 30.4 kDa subunit [Aureobasidium pullulans]|nr:MAG: NADH-ubiquinone oxidoreductase-like protein 30.4 kDa subunit [Aureobasidium pullulans]
MALSSHTSAPSSPFPETPVALARPSHAAVRSTNYDNYNTAFSEDTSYNSTYTSASPSASPSRSLSYSSRTVSAAFGKQVLSAISENVNPGVVATVGSLSRKASLHARARSLVSFVPAFNPTDTEEQNGSSRSPPRKGPSFTDIFTPRRSSLAPSEPEEESEYIISCSQA